MNINTIGPKELAVLLHRTPNTIRADAHRRPETLPPRLNIPGSNRLVWLEEDVFEWIQSLRGAGHEKSNA